MPGYDEFLSINKDSMKKALSELSPERKIAIDEAFRLMRDSGDPIQPMMRQMNFGGNYSFDENRKQVELDGEFSKMDLLRIASIME